MFGKYTTTVKTVEKHERALFGHYDRQRNIAVPGLMHTSRQTKKQVDKLVYLFYMGAVGYLLDHLHVPGFTSWLTTLSEMFRSGKLP